MDNNEMKDPENDDDLGGLVFKADKETITTILYDDDSFPDSPHLYTAQGSALTDCVALWISPDDDDYDCCGGGPAINEGTPLSPVETPCYRSCGEDEDTHDKIWGPGEPHAPGPAAVESPRTDDMAQKFSGIFTGLYATPYELWIRLFCSYTVNLFASSVIFIFLPLILSETDNNMEFVLDSVAVIFLIQLDDLSSMEKRRYELWSKGGLHDALHHDLSSRFQEPR